MEHKQYAQGLKRSQWTVFTNSVSGYEMWTFHRSYYVNEESSFCSEQSHSVSRRVSTIKDSLAQLNEPRHEPHNSEFFLIASKSLVVKA